MTTELIAGGMHVDARGCLRFCNDFDLTPVRRFYTVRNSTTSPRRGWILHRRETKWFFPLTGVTKVWWGPDCADARCSILKAEEPGVLKIEPGNWFLIEQDGQAEVMVFSDSVLGEFPDDDFRKEDK